MNKIFTFIKNILLFIYDFFFVQYFQSTRLKLHKNINLDPIIIINGQFNLQISHTPHIFEMDALNINKTNISLIDIVPMVNSETNAKFVYDKIKGNHVQIGKYSEYSEGVYHMWNENNPINIIAHSYGCNVVLELVNYLKQNNMDPKKMIHKIVFINPCFLSEKNNYEIYHKNICKYYSKWSEMCSKNGFLRSIYNPKETIIKKNKFPINYLNYHVSFPFEEFMIDNKKVFEIKDYVINQKSLMDYSNLNIPHKIYIGNIVFYNEYMLHNILISPLYMFFSIKLNMPKIQVFDGMAYYDKNFCKNNNFILVDSLGHFDLFFDINPCIYWRNRLFYHEILTFLRNKKN